jgi:hypothetical protein
MLISQHIAQALSTKNVDLERLYRMIETYFPSPDDLINGDHTRSRYLYIRSMTDHQRSISDEYRKNVMTWYDETKRDRL